MVAKQLGVYLWLILKRCFEKLFLLFDAFGLLFFVLSKNQPSFPMEVSLIIFGLVFVFSAFTVWRDEVIKKEELQSQFDDLTSQIPTYSVEIGNLETYLVTPSLIDEVTSELETTEVLVKMQSATNLALFAQNFSAASVLGGMFSPETAEDKAKRLKEYVNKLLAYDKKMRGTYKVPIKFEASRADSNIEFKIETTDQDTLIVGNEYPQRKLPQTHKPSTGFGYVPALTGRSYMPNSDSFYISKTANGNVASSRIRKINANRKHNVFSEDFYIQSNDRSVSIEITVYSEKRVIPQIINMQVNLEHATLTEIGKH